MFWVWLARYKLLIIVGLLVVGAAVVALAFIGLFATRRRRLSRALEAMQTRNYSKAASLFNAAFLVPVYVGLGTRWSMYDCLRHDEEILEHLSKIYSERNISFELDSLRELLKRTTKLNEERTEAKHKAAQEKRKFEDDPEYKRLDDEAGKTRALLRVAIGRLPSVPQ